MRILSLLLIFGMLFSFAACNQEPVTPDETSADSVSEEATTPEETTAPEEPEEDPSYAPSSEGFEWVAPDGSYKLVFSKATVVTQGEPGDATWGHYQFPSIGRTREGFLVCSWSYSTDTIDYKPAPAGMVLRKVSVNKGKSWMLPTALDAATAIIDENLMANGQYFTGFSGHAAHKVDYLFNYTPGVTWGDGYNGYKMFFRDDIMNDPSEDAAIDTKIYCNTYDPETKTTTKHEVELNWPWAPVTQHPGNKAYPITMTFALCNGSKKVIDGIPYMFIYTHGFDTTAATKEEAAAYKYAKYYSVFVLNSPDYGKTWNLLSQVKLDDETFEQAYNKEKKSLEGFCEPMVTVTPDGTWVMLMRAGTYNPSFITFSKDQGKTWTQPEVFDECGVLPHIVTLECGATLATYGRPFMYFRSTMDPAGEKWDEHITIPLCTTPTLENFSKVSCFNNELIIIDEDTAMIAYSDFRYPNKQGTKVKTILTRTIDVVMLDEE